MAGKTKTQPRPARHLPEADGAEDHHTLASEAAEAAEALTLPFYPGGGAVLYAVTPPKTALSPTISPR
jgi:hypothetical protein